MIGRVSYKQGDIAYYRDGVVQQQVRISKVTRTFAICVPLLTRHRETINGRETGTWARWSPVNGTRSKPLNVRVGHLARTADPA